MAKMYRIMLDPGHGKPSPGAVHWGIKEYILTFLIARELENLLKQHPSFEVMMTKYNESENPSLSKRASSSNQFNADIFISIHLNSFETGVPHGHEVLFCEGSVEGKNLAFCINEELHHCLYPVLKNRGIKTDIQARGEPLTVLRKTKAPAVIVEGFFLSNEEDFTLADEKGCALVANAIYHGIVNYYEFGSLV